MSQEPVWDRFVLRIDIRAPREAIYRAWSTRAGMEAWFLRECRYLDRQGNEIEANFSALTGDRYLFRWHGYPNEVQEEGRVLEENGRDLFVFSFGKAGNCRVSIANGGELCILALEQTEIPDDEAGRMNWHVGCKTGWTFYLANLKSLLEGGIDLRNKDIGLQNMLNA